MRKVFLDNLPRWEEGKNKGNIKWNEFKMYKLKFIYDDIKGEIEILDYEVEKQQLKIKYNNKEFETKANNIVYCKLSKIIGKRTLDFKIEKGTIFKDDKRDITIIDKKIITKHKKNGYKQNWKYYKYKCNKCGFDGNYHWNIKEKQYKNELWIEESNLLNAKGCSCCCPSPKIVVEHINSIVATDPWMIPIVGEEVAKTHTYRSNTKVKVVCPDYGMILECVHIDNIYKNKGISCSKCGDGISYPNKFMFNLLQQLNINFETEYSPDWIKPKRFDFYFKLNNKEYILEMDGGLGHGNKNYKNNMTSEKSQDIDDYKDEQARLHNIEVIRIDCDYPNMETRFDYIKQNIFKDKILNIIFDFNKVDWIKIEEFALSNKVKEACEYKNLNPKWTSKDIGSVMNLSFGCVIRWLKIGNELGWCEYNPQEEISKQGIKNGKNSSKPIKMFDKDMKFIRMFFSARETFRNSEKLFRIKLDWGNISAVCTGKQKTYKNYIFQHATKEEYNVWLQQQN